MGSKIFLSLGVLLAVLLVFSSKIVARDLDEDFPQETRVDASTEEERVDDSKKVGYYGIDGGMGYGNKGGYGGGYGGKGGYGRKLSGYGGKGGYGDKGGKGGYGGKGGHGGSYGGKGGYGGGNGGGKGRYGGSHGDEEAHN